MKTQPARTRIFVQLDPDDIDALDRARRDEGLSRASFARSVIVRRIRTASPVAQESAR